jgi:hypothetical protein
MFCVVELSFHFSKRPSFDIELKKYGEDEKHMLAQSVEQMYEVSTVLIPIFAWHGWIL